MFNRLSLQSIFCHQIEDSSCLFARSTHQFLINQSSPSLTLLDHFEWQEPLLSEEKLIENWKLLLALNLLCNLTHSFQVELSNKVIQYEKHPWNRSSQYLRALIALNHALAKMPTPEVGPHLLESGAALIDLYEYCPWLSLPYIPYHFEFGIFLSLLASLTKQQALQETVMRLAHWQLNTLDIEAKPLKALFVREQDGKTLSHLCLSYLFFKSASLLTEETQFALIAEKTIRRIQERIEETQEKINPLWVLIEKWLDQHENQTAPPSSSFELSEHIYDPSTALVGYRTQSQHVICTLHGVKTGLGALRYKDVEIVNYGPQYLPLGECQGFGIEGNSLSDQGMRRTMIEWRRGAFILKGCTRLIDQPTNSPFDIGKFRGLWFEIVQEFKKPHFYLKTACLGLDGWESIAFSFFVKATSCKIQSQILHPQMLEQYQGPLKTILFEGQNSQLEIRPLISKEITMQVIPLAGGNNFWGADFLVAYLMSFDQRHYQWHIGPPQKISSSHNPKG